MKVTYFKVTRIEIEPGDDNSLLYDELGNLPGDSVIINPELNVIESRAEADDERDYK